ncbi:TIGR03545 family protein [Thalassotalea atypica]|uniref:TIGR03545 family protein n=1 Tax=Thalassotalea atypica TaxID=2054316 RepID=UPI0025725099|nr:TIGR03545 family protein [Thalassotalea atypica]
MHHYIRWQGFAFFTAIVFVIALVFYIFAEPLAKIAIENGVSEYTGAEVNVGQVELAFSPMTLTVMQMQMTDPKKPSHNIASFDQATARISLWPYLFGKTIIDDLSIEALKLSSARKSIGEVYVAPNAQTENGDPLDESWLESLEQSLPDPRAVLENSNLKTVKRAQAFEQSYQEEKLKIEQLKQQLPEAEKLKEFEQRVKALTKTKVKSLEDLERIKSEFDTLKKEFKVEQAKVSSAKKELLASKDNLAQQLVDLKNAPQEDWQDIEKKYQLDKLDAQDFAHIIFGEKAREYYQVAELAFKYIKPLLSKDNENPTDAQSLDGSKGRFVHFDEDNPMPEFLLKKGKISIVLPRGEYVVELSDITHQHWLLNKKSRVQLIAKEQSTSGDIALDSHFALSKGQELTADGKWNFSKFTLQDIVLKESERLNLSLNSSLLAGSGQLAINNGELNLDSLVTLNENDFVGSANSKLGNVVVETLKNAKNLDISIDAIGDILSPNWSISSPLDDMFTQAFKQQIGAKLSGYKTELQSGLNDKLKNALDLGHSQETELLDIEALLTGSENTLDSLENNDVLKKKQKELEDKAKDKLKEKLGKLFG